MRNGVAFNSVCVGELHEVGIDHIYKGKTTSEEQLLPLTYVSQAVVVEKNDFDSGVFLKDGAEFFNGHLKTSVACEDAHLTIGAGDFCSNGRR